jgi:hypothetical protein
MQSGTPKMVLSGIYETLRNTRGQGSEIRKWKPISIFQIAFFTTDGIVDVKEKSRDLWYIIRLVH